MTITVIGDITRDTLIFPNQGWRVVENLGGTLYTVNALASLTERQIVLACNIGDDIYDKVIEILRRMPSVSLSAIRRFEGKHFHCYILFASEYGTQYDEGTEKPVRYSHIKPFIGKSDFILISPMTGFDLDLRTLRKIKATAKCPIYFDYHILSLQRDSLGNRYVMRRKNWLEWCSVCDHLQMNQFEAESLYRAPIHSENDIMKFAKPLLKKGVISVAVTLGKNGALICWQSQNHKIHTAKLDVDSRISAIDTTGCGDVFAAGFIANLMKTQDILLSYRFANTVAGKKSSFSGFDGFAELDRSLEQREFPSNTDI